MHTRVQFRLLVVRLGAMGDILHALPAITSLRRQHPAWHIAWAVEPRWQALLTAGDGSASSSEIATELDPMRQPLVDRLHLVPTKGWGQKPLHPETLRAVARLRDELRAADYDCVLDLQGAIRSAIISRLSACRRVIGEARPREAPARLLYHERVITLGAHVIDQDVELASDVAGDLLEALPPLLPTDPAAELWADELLATPAPTPAATRSPAVAPGPLVIINPGAGWGAKRWPAERYGQVARALADQGCAVLVNAGPGEQTLAEAVAAASGQAARIVSCTLPQLIALTRRATLVVAGDTGPLHLACALGKPVVGIYGPTDPARNGPYGSRFRILRSPISVRDHSRRPDPEAGLLTITPQSVVDAARQLLAEP